MTNCPTCNIELEEDIEIKGFETCPSCGYSNQIGKNGLKMRARLVAKSPYTTWNVEFTYPETNAPKDLFDELKKQGWESYGSNIPSTFLHGNKEISFSKRGSDIFGIWTPEERKNYLKEVRNILKKYGLTKIPKVRLTIQDLL